MNEVAFIEQREPDWKRLTYLTEKADASPVNLTAAELQDFIRLYRKCSSDLALVRTKSNNLQLIDFLNGLLAKAYSTLYRTKRKPIGKAIGDAVALTARTVRKLQWFVLASVLTFAASVAFAFVACASNPDLKNVLEPQDGMYGSAFKEWTSGSFEERSADESIMMSGFYSSNNPRSAIFTGGLAAGSFGIGTALVLWSNGVIMGSLAYETFKVGRLGYLLVHVMPHGVTELSGLFLAGAAGYCLGWALICPGRRKRSAALMEAGKDALVVLCASVVLMFMAAPIEGFFSYNPRVPDWVRIVFILIAAGAWAAFWIGYGREPKETAAA